MSCARARGILADVSDMSAGARRNDLGENWTAVLQLADSMPDGAILARANRIEYVNDAACRLLEARQPEEILGRNIQDLIHDGRQELIRSRLERASMGLSNPPIVIEAVTLRGRRIQVESRSIGLGPSDSAAVLILWRDTRDRRKLEEQLFHSQKMDAIGRLADGVAHEFGNLITVIQGNVDRMVDRMARGDGSVDELKQVRNALRRACALTEQLRAFGDQQVSLSRSVNCNAVVFSMESILRRIIGEDVRLMTLYRKDLWSVHADPAQIEQVVMNLVINAREAMPRGGVLSLETTNRTVTAAREEGPEVEPGEYAVLEVCDTGCGMSAELKEHLFEPFFTTKERRAGLGLSTSYGMIVQNHGKILCRSEPERGTRFLVFLPRVPEGDSAAHGAGLESDAAARVGTVLVVDDEDSIVDVVSTILKDEGFDVVGARDAEEALAVLRERPGSIGLLIADVVMPAINGIELSRMASEIAPRVKVLLLSGYADQTIERYGSLHEGDLLLRKPFSTADLIAAVRVAVRDRVP